MSPLDRLKAACALIRLPESQGTGYLVAPRYVATCAHVVSSADSDFELEFEGRKVWGRVVSDDETTDCAIIELREPLDGVVPLPLAGSCADQAEWRGYGFPQLTRGAGLALEGQVLDPASRTDHGKPALTLYSPQVAAGMAAKVHGFSGSPVLVDGVVVGHLSKVISELNSPGQPALGILYAARSEGVLALLGQSPEVAQVKPGKLPLLGELVPHLGEGHYHAFISYRSSDHEWASLLATRLEGLGLRVFLLRRELQLGAALWNELRKAIAQSQAAIVLISKDWLASPSCQEEATALHGRSVSQPDFRVVSLRLDETELPPPWAGSAWLDLRGKQPSGAELEQIAYALLGRTPPAADSSASRIDRALTGSIDEALPRLKLALTLGVDALRRALRSWHQAGLPMSAVSLSAAEALIAIGFPQEALEVLDEAPTGPRSRQLRALALSKCGAVQEAIALLKQLKAEGYVDAETLGLLGGRLKDRWFKSGHDGDLIEAYTVYREAYAQTGDSYPGINAAALALWLSHTDPALSGESRTLARRILLELGARSEAQLNHHHLATLGEACLLLGEEQHARSWFRKAVGHAEGRYRDIAMMRLHARQDLKKLGRPEDALDGVLPVPRVVLFSGHLVDDPGRAIPRFPESKVPAVKREIERRLMALGRVHGFSSGARGSDVLFLEVLLARDGTADVHLAFSLDDFKRESVGGAWDARLDRLLASEKIQLTLPKTPTPAPAQRPAAFAHCNETLIAAAEEKARLLCEEPLLLAVWDQQAGDEGGTGSVVTAWKALGHAVELIDPTTL